MTTISEAADAGGSEREDRAAQSRDLKRIRRTLLAFAWDNYGLDEVGQATSREWATDLSIEIYATLSKD